MCSVSRPIGRPTVDLFACARAVERVAGPELDTSLYEHPSHFSVYVHLMLVTKGLTVRFEAELESGLSAAQDDRVRVGYGSSEERLDVVRLGEVLERKTSRLGTGGRDGIDEVVLVYRCCELDRDLRCVKIRR